MSDTQTKAALAEIETEGKIVASLAEKIRNTEQEAVKAVEDKIGKSTTLRMELVQRLKVVMPKLKAKGSPMSYIDFKSKYVGKLIGTTQFKQLERIAKGQITFEEIKLIERKKKAGQRAKKKDGTDAMSRPKPDDVVRTADGKPLDTSGLGADAKAQLEKAMAENKPSQPRISDKWGFASMSKDELMAYGKDHKSHMAQEELKAFGEATQALIEAAQPTVQAETASPSIVPAEPGIIPEPQAEQRFGSIKRSEKSVRQSQERAMELLGSSPLDRFKVACEMLLPRLDDKEMADARKYVCDQHMWEKARAKLQREAAKQHAAV